MATKKTPSPHNRNWTFGRVSRNVHRFDISLPNTKSEFWALLTSDCHWDNPHCDRKLMKKLFDKAVERDAAIMDVGDFFCAMQGKYDKRASKSDVRPEHQVNNYLDALISTAAEWLEPYKDHLTLRGDGNHETAISKRHETNLTERLTERLKASGSIAETGGYSGYVRFHITAFGTQRSSLRYFYHHGNGGGGPVTKGVIQTNRRAAFLSDADIVHTGHVHEQWILTNMKLCLTDANKIVHRREVHVCTPGFKEEYGDGHGGYHIENGRPPKPNGAAWLRIYLEGDKVEFEVTEAR